MFDIRRHRSPDSAVHARNATPAGVRYGVLILIAVSVVVWVSNRNWSGSSAATVFAERIRGLVVRAGLQPTGSFYEPITGLEGIEISRPGCPKPIALLPVHSSNTEIAPGGLSYGDGDYSVAYAFDGQSYTAAGISYKLGIIVILHRLRSLVAGSDSNRLLYYFKIWTPRGCDELTSAELERLRDAD